MKITHYNYDEVSGSLTISGKVKREVAIALLIAGEVAAVAPASEVQPERATKPGKAPKTGKGKPARAAEVEDEDEDEEEEVEEEDDAEDDEEEDEDDGDEEEDDTDDDEPPAKKARGGKAAAGAAKKALRVTAEMKAAAKLRDVIAELVKQGVGEDDLVAACKALRDKIPVLSRIAELEKRVPQAYEMVAEDLKKKKR